MAETRSLEAMERPGGASHDERASRCLDILERASARPFGDLFALVEFTRALYDHDDGQALIERLTRDPEAVRLLIDQPELGLSDAELARCAPGTLGAAIVARHGKLPLLPFGFGGTDVHAYVVRRLVETAPFWQEVLGVEPGDDARMLVLGFYAAQVSPAATFLALIAKNLVKVALERSDRHDEHLAALIQGWELGRRTRPLFGADWRRLAERPLGEVRARFGITRADAEENTRLTANPLASAEDEGAGVDREGFLEVFRRVVLLPYGDAGLGNGQELRRCLVTAARGGRFAARLLADPDVRTRLTTFPRLTGVDFRALHELPVGSLGRAYADHMLVKGFDPPPSIAEGEKDLSRFFAGHIIETHDVWHAVSGAGTDKRGECCLHAFYNGQLHPLPVQLAYLARCILKTVLFDLDRADLHMDAIARGWRLGRSARPLALVDWRTLFPEPLAEVRARFEIPLGGVEDLALH